MFKKCIAAFALAILTLAAEAHAGRFVAAAEKGIHNRYLVLLADSPIHAKDFALTELPPVHEVAREILAVRGLRPLRIYEHAVRGFLVEMPEAAARRLARDPRVARVEQDQEIEIQAPA